MTGGEQLEFGGGVGGDPGRDGAACRSKPVQHRPDFAGESKTSAEDSQGDSVESAPPRYFFLTNRMNLNGLLSSRLLAPRDSFYKYYADLLELTPGWVPIFVGRPPTALIDRVVAERGAGEPVLVELQASAMNVLPSHGLFVCIRAAPLSDIKAIHFRDEKGLREHRARRYSNVHPHDSLLQVSPECFMSSRGEGTVATPDESPGTDWLNLDRVRGAVSAAVAASDSGVSLAVTAGLLGASKIPRGIVLPPWLTWAGLTGEVRPSAHEADAETADRLIFQAAYRVFGTLDQAESWSPSEVLDAVAEDITTTNLTDEPKRIVDRNLRRVSEILNIERDFEPFRDRRSSYVAAKSLLLVLLRPDLTDLLEWPRDETGADETTRVVAAVLAGRLRGITRESVALRNIALDDLTAAWAVRAANGVASSIGSAQFVADPVKTALFLDGVSLHNAAPLRPDTLVL